MIGLYLHVPFCHSKCIYCDFYSIAVKSLVAEYIIGIRQELQRRCNEASNQQIGTIYFGGGTPSILPIKSISEILTTIRQNYSISPEAEITFEANPDNLTNEYLEALTELGVNRLSIGIQSFNDKTLGFLRRRHTSEQAIKSVELANRNGINNISIDLIYGINGLSTSEWAAELDLALSLPITHLSCYCLGIEDGTLLARYQREGKYTSCNDEICFEQYMLFDAKTKDKGFCHYEISNAAKQGFFSRHNTSYWNGTAYLGFGPSAHSYSNNTRRWNIANVQEYCKKLNEGKSFYASEHLSENEQLEETIMLSLRTAQGLDLHKLSLQFGENQCRQILSKVKYMPEHLYKIEDNHLKLSAEGMFLSDSIIIKLMP